MIKKSTIIFGIIIFLAGGFQQVVSKSIANRSYVQSGLTGRFYIRAIPAEAKGDKGTTFLYLVKDETDEIVDKYNWFARRGVVMGWSPIAGKVAILKIGGLISRNFEKQVEFSIYLGGKHLKTYTTNHLIKMGAEVTSYSLDLKERAKIEFLECKQMVDNEYAFAVKISKTKTVFLDILTGKIYRKAK